MFDGLWTNTNQLRKLLSSASKHRSVLFTCFIMLFYCLPTWAAKLCYPSNHGTQMAESMDMEPQEVLNIKLSIEDVINFNENVLDTASNGAEQGRKVPVY
ncbi:hypothetical protein V2J09_009962 [Rumex salicifolius]